jgi:dienelactone hydrolase
LIIFIHGGAFLFGSKEDYLITRFCKDFARAGFATASINYSKINLEEGHLFSSKKVILEALEDARTAILYFRKKSRELNIDPNRIYIVGYSAGGIIANQLIFTDSEEAQNYYYDNNINYNLFETPINRLVAGVISISGAVMDYRDLDDKDTKNLKLMLIHGTNDLIVPIGKDKLFRILDKRQSISLPGLILETGRTSVNEKEQTQEQIKEKLTISPSLSVPPILFNWIRNLIFPKDICGSDCIYTGIRAKRNIIFYSVEEGPHSLMMKKNGSLNKTYDSIRKKIYKFID